MAKILIAGCGRLGKPLGSALVSQGHEVWGIRRSKVSDDTGIHYQQADICDPSMPGIPFEPDLAFYILTPGERSEKAYRKVYLDGLDNLLARYQGPIVFVSSTSVYGQDRGEWVDEASPTLPASYRGEVLLAAEEMVLHAPGSPGSCVVRFSGIYEGISQRLVDRLASGDRVIQYSPPLYTNRIHREDCVGVLEMVADRILSGNNPGPILLASDCDPAPMWDVMSYAASLLGKNMPEKGEPGRGKPGDSTSQNKRCSSNRLQEQGFKFRFPSYRQGFVAGK